MMILLTASLLIVAGYGFFLVGRLGILERLPLALGPISLDRIPLRAARRHGERILFTTDRPCRWDVPALKGRYPDPKAWSALRIDRTAGFVAAVLKDRCAVRYPDRVAIMKENHLDMHVLMTAVVRAGGVACPLNDRFEPEKVGLYLAHIGARLLVSDCRTLRRLIEHGADLDQIERVVVADRRDGAAGHLPSELERLLISHHPCMEVIWLEEALGEVAGEAPPVSRGPQEPLYLVHSSGTTGFPKAVVLKNGPQSHAVRGWLCYVHLSRRWDRGYLAVPNNHQAVILSFNSLLLWGFSVHWTGEYHRDAFDAKAVLQELAEGEFTGYFGFPITYTQLKELPLEELGLERMRFWASTADASHEAIVRRFVTVGRAFRSLGWPVHGSVFLDAQGSSEVGTPSVIRYVTPFTRRFGRRIGRPGSVPFGPRIRIMATHHRPARRGEVGRLEVKGRTVFAGYWNRDDLTFEAMRDDWFFTGDLVREAEDGHLIQLDREVDVIRTRKGPIYTLPLEEELHRHPAVFDLCVYGARQLDGSQLPAAAVALREGFEVTEEQLAVELNHLLDAEAMLDRVEILPWREFPVGVTGKTLKRRFRARSESRPSGHSPEGVPSVPHPPPNSGSSRSSEPRALRNIGR